jgi:hypothetical protein
MMKPLMNYQRFVRANKTPQCRWLHYIAFQVDNEMDVIGHNDKFVKGETGKSLW